MTTREQAIEIVIGLRRTARFDIPLPMGVKLRELHQERLERTDYQPCHVEQYVKPFGWRPLP
jgi:hypothetical protein